jgi:hypothetical protein
MYVYRDVFVMRDIRIPTRSRYARSVRETRRLFLWNLSQRESLRVVSGEDERGSLHPLQMGAGVRSLLQKDSFCSGLDDLAVGLFCGENYQQSHSKYVLRGDARVNKLFTSTECFIL